MSSDSQRAADDDAAGKQPECLGGTCAGCKVEAAIYETDPCRHLVFCKRCAMRCASGGKCKKCGELYAGLRRRH